MGFFDFEVIEVVDQFFLVFGVSSSLTGFGSVLHLNRDLNLSERATMFSERDVG